MPTVPVEAFNFCGPTYLLPSPVIDSQRCFNMYPEKGVAASKSPWSLIGRPGLSNPAYVTLATSPARALWAGDNRLFAVGGTRFYEVSNAGGIVTDYGVMASSTGIGWCQISSNGEHLLVLDSSSQRIYRANTVGPAMNTVQYAGADFRATALEYLDGFHVAIATGASLQTTNPNQINVSNNLDGTTWQTLNYAIRTGSADLTIMLAVLNSQLWIFGRKTIEVWYNAGLPTFPFARITGATINLGLMAAASVVKFYNCMMWLGADDRGYSQVYMSQGLNPVRVSSPGVEYLLNLPTTIGILPLCQAYGYQESGHTFYVLNFMSSGTLLPIQTLVYDLTTGLWHERLYRNIGSGPWPVSFASVPGFNSTGPNFVGDGYSGAIHFQGINYAADGIATNTILYRRDCPHVSNSNRWVKHNRFELDCDIGTAQPTLVYSNDGGRNYGAQNRALQQAVNQGTPASSPTGRRYFANQLGRSRDRVYRLLITNGTELIRIAGAYLNVSPGTED